MPRPDEVTPDRVMVPVFAFLIRRNSEINICQRLPPIPYGHWWPEFSVGRWIGNLDLYSGLVLNHMVGGDQIAIRAMSSFTTHPHEKAGAAQVAVTRNAHSGPQT